jgi:hypothetical protein
MSVVAALVAAAVVGLALLSAREKARQRDREIATIRELDLPEARTTPLSQGIVDIVAVAGGIYLSLVMVAGFVGYAVPGKISLLGSQIDPVAVIAVSLALFEPFLSRLFVRT